MSPVTAPVIPPVSNGTAHNDAPPVTGANATLAIPANTGINLDKKPASGKPVLGFIVREPPCCTANACNPFTSPGVMWIRTVSFPRPAD